MFLQLILEDFKSIENKSPFSLISTDSVHGSLVDGFTGNTEHSESVGSIVSQNFPVIGWDALLLHDSCHHFGRALRVNLTSVGDAILADDTHPLQVGIKLKPAIDKPTMSTLTLKAEDDLRIGMLLVEPEPSELKSFDFHGIANKFILGLDNRVVRCHVGEDGIEEGSTGYTFEHLVDTWLVIGNGWIKFTFIGWNQRMKIHVILSESPGLVEAAKLDHSTDNHLILGYTENPLAFQSLHRIDDAEGHTDRQGRWHCDGNQIEELLNQILRLHILVDEDN